MMTKTILLTGATDGIGLATAHLLAAQGHHLILHGRNPAKLESAVESVSANSPGAKINSIQADLSLLSDTREMLNELTARFTHIDVLINNAGVFKTSSPVSAEGLDVRFVVNTIAPYMLTLGLRTLMDVSSRIVNVSSAAQAPLALALLEGNAFSDDAFQVYAQSKLAIINWTKWLTEQWQGEGPMLVSVNPGSLLASKMVKEGFGMAGNDISIGANILVKAALSHDFAQAHGKYFDNDSGQFAPPHPGASDEKVTKALINAMETLISD